MGESVSIVRADRRLRCGGESRVDGDRRRSRATRLRAFKRYLDVFIIIIVICVYFGCLRWPIKAQTAEATRKKSVNQVEGDVKSENPRIIFKEGISK